MKRKNQNKCYRTHLYEYLSNISSNHTSQTYVNNQSIWCIKLFSHLISSFSLLTWFSSSTLSFSLSDISTDVSSNSTDRNCFDFSYISCHLVSWWCNCEVLHMSFRLQIPSIFLFDKRKHLVFFLVASDMLIVVEGLFWLLLNFFILYVVIIDWFYFQLFLINW